MTGCSDLFRLLLQGGASLYALDFHHSRTTDIITTIWDLNIREAQFRYRFNETEGQPIGGALKFDECVAMTQLALDNDCNIYDANKEIVSSGPLFSIANYYMINDLDPSKMKNVIQYLISIGYELEESNRFGQTPLFLAALDFGLATTMIMGLLIERGARLDTKDDLGLGLLHTVLLRYLYLMNLGNEPHPYDRYGELELRYGYSHPSDFSRLPDERDMYFEMRFLLRQDLAEDCRPQESVGDHFSRATSTSVYKSTPSNLDSGSYAESSRRVGPQGSQVAVERSLSTVASILESESDAAFGYEESILEVNDVDGHVIYRDDDGEERWIRNPVPLLKARIATKLKILLEAGCDPNMLDDNGLSPSDYANEGKWIREAWFWTLRETGHAFDAVQDRWIKRRTPT